MAGTIYSGTYTNGIGLTNPYSTVSSTSVIGVANQDAIYGAAGTAWNLTNYGQIGDNGTIGSGIQLAGGGTIDNAALIQGVQSGVVVGVNAGGTIATAGGTVFNSGTIVATGASGDGVVLVAGGSVSNDGTITASGTGGQGVLLVANGNVTNGATGATAALIIGAAGVNLDEAAGTVTNYGTIEGTGTVGQVGLHIAKGGVVTNGYSGATTGLILAYRDAIYIGGSNNTAYPGAAGAVTNFGTIESTGTASATGGHNAIFMDAGGSVLNHGAILGTEDGVGITGAPGTVTNYGTISGGTDGVAIGAGGTVINRGVVISTGGEGHGIDFTGGGSLINYGTIGNAATPYVTGTVTNFDGVVTASNDPVAITNFGTIAPQGAANGVNLHDGGTIVNGSTVATNAVIAGPETAIYAGGDDSVPITGATASIVNYGTVLSIGAGSAIGLTGGGNPSAGSYESVVSTRNVYATVDNFGTISPTNTNNGVGLDHGGTIVNGSTGATNALISGLEDGIYAGGRNDTVYGAGAVSQITNFGTIESIGTGPGIHIVSGGTVTNEAGGLITAYDNAINGGTNTAIGVINYGSIGNTGSHAAVYLGAGGTVVNGSAADTGAAIGSAVRTGVAIENDAGTVTNYGTIASTAPLSGTAGSGVYLQAGGAITNAAGGTISAERNAVSLGGTVATGAGALVINSGVIDGNVGVAVSSFDTGSNTIVNYGTISGTSGDAVVLGSGAETLVIEPGSALTGSVADFAVGDTIDFAGVAASGATLSGGTLTLLNGGGAAVGSVGLSGVSGLDHVTVAADGSGGTDIGLESAVAHDFNGDGQSDLLWQYENAGTPGDPGNGETALWLMNGATATAQAIIADPGPYWDVAATGGFTGNGLSDVVWQYENAGTPSDPLNGETALWLMNGATATAQAIIADPGAAWHVAGAGDFTGNGQSDILWQYENAGTPGDPGNGETALWLMNGATATSQAIIADPGAAWHVAGTGDFTGTGQSDILWQYENAGNAGDPLNGETALWLMNGATATAQAIIADPGPYWTVAATGDFTGTGQSDIVWQYEDGANAGDPNNGQTALWLMNGATATAQAIIANPGPDWHVVGTGDLAGTGKSDILWQYDNAANPSDPLNGTAAAWTMSGTTVTAQAILANPPPSWHMLAG